MLAADTFTVATVAVCAGLALLVVVWMLRQ